MHTTSKGAPTKVEFIPPEQPLYPTKLVQNCVLPVQVELKERDEPSLRATTIGEVDTLRAADDSVQCLRMKNLCVTHNCEMTRTVERVRKWTKVKFGFANRTQARTRWICVLSDSTTTENHETSQSRG